MDLFREEAFSIKKDNQQTLYGIIHNPVKPNGSLVILLNIGMQFRVCHSRLFVLHARFLQEAGYTVVRIDTTGVGYSQGEHQIERSVDLFDSIQTGFFKNDVLEIVKYFKQKLNPAKIFLVGLCGGALSAIFSAIEDESINGIIFTAGPITLTSAEFSLSALHPFEAEQMMKGYLGKIANPKAWGRFFSGKTSYKDIYYSIKVRLTGKSVVSRQDSDDGIAATNSSEEFKGEIFNQAFFEAFKSLMKFRRPILFIMPQLDRTTYDFDKIFLPMLVNFKAEQAFYSVARIEKADHTFTQPESVREMFNITLDWLNKNIK